MTKGIVRGNKFGITAVDTDLRCAMVAVGYTKEKALQAWLDCTIDFDRSRVTSYTLHINSSLVCKTHITSNGLVYEVP